MQQIIPQNLCESPECRKPGATMQCPTCITLGLPNAFFCNKDCFKSFWPLHKFAHKKEKKDDYDYSGPLRPNKKSGWRTVPDHIKRPDYAKTGVPISEQKLKSQKIIPIHDEEQIELTRTACLIGRKALDLAHKTIAVGVTTDEIDRVVHQFIIENDAYPSPLNYYNFPKSCCTSVNEVVCHGIPDFRPLEQGDICNVDITACFKGYHGDLNETFFVGQNIPKSSKELVSHTYKSLMDAIAICKPGTMYRQIGNLISTYIESQGLSVVRTYCGHGCGRMFHCPPTIPHYGKNKAFGIMKPGHIFTIQPMINMGGYKDKLWKDKWTSVTVDGQRSAQFEHQMLVTDDGVEVLTARLQSSPSLNLLDF